MTYSSSTLFLLPLKNPNFHNFFNFIYIFIFPSYFSLPRLSEPIRKTLLETPYTPPEGSTISVKAVLGHLLPSPTNLPNIGESQIRASIRDFALACALLSSSQSSTHDLVSWIPANLSASAESAIRGLSRAYSIAFGEANAKRIGGLGLDCGVVPEEKRLVVELMPEVFPSLKDAIKESSIDKLDAADEVSAASARAPVGFAVVAAHQFRWFVTQV